SCCSPTRMVTRNIISHQKESRLAMNWSPLQKQKLRQEIDCSFSTSRLVSTSTTSNFTQKKADRLCDLPDPARISSVSMVITLRSRCRPKKSAWSSRPVTQTSDVSPISTTTSLLSGKQVETATKENGPRSEER